MRKRSGALHSDSSEEFMLLAELAYEKNGYFYDERLHRQVDKQLTNHKYGEVQVTNSSFCGFDYSSHHGEIAQEERDMQNQCERTEINFTLICTRPALIRVKLQQLWPGEYKSMETGGRDLDLFVVRQNVGIHGHHCCKFWIIDAEQVCNVMYESYLKRAKRIVTFNESGVGEGECYVENEAKGVLFSMVSASTH